MYLLYEANAYKIIHTYSKYISIIRLEFTELTELIIDLTMPNHIHIKIFKLKNQIIINIKNNFQREE